MRISDWSSDVCSSDLMSIDRDNSWVNCFCPMKGPEDSNCKMPDAENQIRKNVDISAGASSEPAEGVCSMLASDLKRALREFFDHVERIVDRQGEGGSDIAILASSVVDLKDDFV